MAYVDSFALGEAESFQQRVQVAVLIAAKQVQGEARGDYSQTHYDKRQQLARSVILGVAQWVPRFTLLAATNPVLTLNSTDDDIQFTINSLWDDAAGVTADD
ncbi:MAG TPA: hypothetical protein VHK64_05925 [Nocardioidaceae bacterium]|jgi:hypothetical protein|nr:hypothetical protein [Nocardioidaceae bacterium]